MYVVNKIPRLFDERDDEGFDEETAEVEPDTLRWPDASSGIRRFLASVVAELEDTDPQGIDVEALRGRSA